MRLSEFIRDNLEPILVEWESFARTMTPASDTMSVLELRDHAHDMLLMIADDLDSPQTEEEQHNKSIGDASKTSQVTASAVHGEMRYSSGFDVLQLSAEYRAVRASVLRLWTHAAQAGDSTVLEDVSRFNEAVDQGFAEALQAYSEHVAKSRDTFLAVLGHDLRNPLSALNSCVRLLSSTHGATNNDQTLQIAKLSIASMGDMITDLLEYTRTRLGRGLEIKPKQGNFSALCQEAFDEVRVAYPHRQLECDVPDGVHLNFDAPRMRQVLINLLSNGVHYGAEEFPVLLVLSDSGLDVRLTVKNKGVPIPHDAMQVIFDPLVQVPSKETALHERPTTSLGLGLYIAREIVLGHGGTISVTSSADEGTAFRVSIPRPKV